MNMIPKTEDHGEISIGNWSISEELGIVSSPEGKSLILEPRLSRLMYLLALNDGAIISRQYLTDHLWPDTIVNEESLTKAIADLRKLLSQNFQAPPQILTLRKRGYQLIISTGPRMLALKLKLSKRQLIGALAIIATALILFWAVS